MKAIEIKDLSFKYENENILENVSFAIDQNEFVGVIGPNGGGKTTLIKLILGFLPMQKGKIKIFGKNPKEMVHQIGYVPQLFNVDRHFPLSVLDLVMMGAVAKAPWFGFYPKEIKEKAKKLLAMVNLSRYEESSFGKLSGGQIQKALIAKALISDPKILILDEPTANIDLQSEKEIMKILCKELENRTILMVTHNIQMIVHNVQKALCVQKHVTCMFPKEICEHFALGLYHYPLVKTKENHL